MTGRWPLFIACGLIVVALGYTAFRETGILGAWRLSRMNAQVESENRRLREENVRDKQEVDDLRYNWSRMEMEARKLGYIYPDESVVYLKLDNGTTVRIFVRPHDTAKPTRKGGVEKRGAEITF